MQRPAKAPGVPLGSAGAALLEAITRSHQLVTSSPQLVELLDVVGRPEIVALHKLAGSFRKDRHGSLSGFEPGGRPTKPADLGEHGPEQLFVNNVGSPMPV